MAILIHATKRAIERLRWPAEVGAPSYVAGIGGVACGAELDSSLKYASGEDRSDYFFRAEDARALLRNQKTSTLYRQAHGRAVREKGRVYSMPTCVTCLMLVDEALMSPLIIHAEKALFHKKTTMLRWRVTETVRPPGDFQRAACDGSSLEKNSVRFTRAHLEGKRDGRPLWWPTCPECRKMVEDEFFPILSVFNTY